MKSRLEHLMGSDLQPARITILYEDLPTALRANALIECPCYWNQLTEESETEFWRFDLLGDVAQRKAAVKMANHSRLVVLSALNQNSIQPAVEHCVNAWLESRAQHAGAFAVLFAHPNSISRYGRAMVADWWRRATEQRMKFYCDLPEWQSDFLFGSRSMRERNTDFSRLAGCLN
jgi:hypothetical protein